MMKTFSREAFINAVPDLCGPLVCKVFAIRAIRFYKPGRKKTQTNTDYSRIRSGFVWTVQSILNTKKGSSSLKPVAGKNV